MCSVLTKNYSTPTIGVRRQRRSEMRKVNASYGDTVPGGISGHPRSTASVATTPHALKSENRGCCRRRRPKIDGREEQPRDLAIC